MLASGSQIRLAGKFSCGCVWKCCVPQLPNGFLGFAECDFLFLWALSRRQLVCNIIWSNMFFHGLRPPSLDFLGSARGEGVNQSSSQEGTKGIRMIIKHWHTMKKSLEEPVWNQTMDRGAGRRIKHTRTVKTVTAFYCIFSPSAQLSEGTGESSNLDRSMDGLIRRLAAGIPSVWAGRRLDIIRVWQ